MEVNADLFLEDSKEYICVIYLKTRLEIQNLPLKRNSRRQNVFHNVDYCII